MRFLRPFLVAFAVLVPPAALVAQPDLDAAARRTVIDSLLAQLDASYVFPETAAAMERDIRARLAAGDYNDLGDRERFAERLTEDLQSVSHDRHLRVRTGPPQRPSAGTGGDAPDPSSAFGRVEILAGNVGYVEIRSFGFPPGAVRPLVRDAMTSVADAAALIIDLRANGGGDPGFVALVSSYLFDDEPVHLNSLYFRPSDRTTDFHTDPDVEGRRFGGSKPVYVLTINPITCTNWEGTGVVPEVEVPADTALEEALRRARSVAQ